MLGKLNLSFPLRDSIISVISATPIITPNLKSKFASQVPIAEVPIEQGISSRNATHITERIQNIFEKSQLTFDGNT